MKDINNNIWNKRVPSFIGVFIFIFAIGTITWLSRNTILFGTKAAISNTPQNVQVSNITDASFTISYTTGDSVLGTINYGKTQPPAQIALDDQDKGTAAAHSVHLITIKNLDPATKYFFIITSGDKNFDNKNVPYDVTTGPKITTAQQQVTTIKGKVILDDGRAPGEALAYVSSSDSQTFATLVQADGSYQFNLDSIRDKSLAKTITLTPDAKLNLQIIDSTHKSNVALLLSQAGNIPIIILSKDYNFTIGNEPLSPSPIASASGTPAAFPTTSEINTNKPQILTPQTDQSFKDQQPLFKGKAVPNADVEITIQSAQEINTTVSADPNGNWQYRPTTALAPGNHTITIKTVDASGIVKTITQSFVVFAAGSQFTEPSGTPTVSPTTKPTTAPTSTAVPTSVKTTTTPTAIPTTTTAPSPTKITSNLSPTTPPVPVTGNTSLMFTIIAIASTVSIGALLFFFTIV